MNFRIRMFVKSAVNSARATAHSEGKHCQLETEVIQRPRICKELATKYYSYTANEAEARITLYVKSTRGVSLQRTEDSRSPFSPFYSKLYFTTNSLEHR